MLVYFIPMSVYCWSIIATHGVVLYMQQVRLCARESLCADTRLWGSWEARASASRWSLTTSIIGRCWPRPGPTLAMTWGVRPPSSATLHSAT